MEDPLEFFGDVLRRYFLLRDLEVLSTKKNTWGFLPLGRPSYAVIFMEDTLEVFSTQYAICRYYLYRRHFGCLPCIDCLMKVLSK